MDTTQEIARRRIILPLDFPTLTQALVTLITMRELVSEVKIGLEAITGGFANTLAEVAHELGLYVGWDGKWDDIGETVRRAAEALVKKGTIKWCNVHASAGAASVEAAVKVCHALGSAKVYGVTVLTSIDPAECQSIFGDEPGPKVLQFTSRLLEKDADGIICSPKELGLLGQHPEFNKLTKTTPGVRPLWAATNDQKRVMTPAEAIKAGADYLVIGRPINKPPESIGSPQNAVEAITLEMADAIRERIDAGTWKED
jgi:orotidine-5'-phosphate decarboxylase